MNDEELLSAVNSIADELKRIADAIEPIAKLVLEVSEERVEKVSAREVTKIAPAAPRDVRVRGEWTTTPAPSAPRVPRPRAQL